MHDVYQQAKHSFKITYIGAIVKVVCRSLNRECQAASSCQKLECHV